MAEWTEEQNNRHLLWWIICLDLLTVIWLGYRYLDRKIPDELYVTESQEQQVKNVLDYPLLSFDDAITVSGDGSYLLSSRILGVIPFKDVKVIPQTVRQCLSVEALSESIWKPTEYW